MSSFSRCKLRFKALKSKIQWWAPCRRRWWISSMKSSKKPGSKICRSKRNSSRLNRGASMQYLNFRTRAKSGRNEKIPCAKKLTNKISLKRIHSKTGLDNLKMNSCVNKSRMIKNTSYLWNKYRPFNQHTSHSYSIQVKPLRSLLSNYKTKRLR